MGLFSKKAECKEVTQDYRKKALAAINLSIAQIKNETDFYNVLPVLKFAEDVELITLDEGISYYELAKNNLDKAERAKHERTRKT